MKKTNVFLITQNEPFFIPKMVNFITRFSNSLNFEVVGITILKPSRKNSSIIDWLKERLTMYNFLELTIVSFFLFYTMIVSKFGTKNKKKKYSLENIIKYNNLNSIKTDSINNLGYIRKLESLKIDILISISSPQIFKLSLINVPKKACVNAHGTFLPYNRGVHGSWWTLFNGTKSGGSTIHFINPKIDSGDIIAQREFDIEKSDTQFSVAFKSKKLLSELLIISFFRIIKGNCRPKKMKISEGTYNYAPSSEQVKLFRQKSLKILTINDFFRVITKKFS